MKRTASPALFYFLFFMTGVGVMLLGVLAPALQLQQNDAQIGRLLATQFTGQLLGALLVARNPYRSLQIGLCLVVFTAITIGVMHTPWLPLLFVYGLGMGITMTAANIAAGIEVPAEKRVARLEMLNAVWPLGAMCSPLLVRVWPGSGMRLYVCVAALALIGMGSVLMRPGAMPETDITQSETSASSSRVVFLLCLLGLFAVGVETAVSNWSSMFGVRYFPATRAVTLAPMVFWMGILAGRSLASRVSKRVGWLPLMLATSLFAAGAITAIAFCSSPGMLLITTFVCALCVAPLYPAVLAQCIILPGKNFVFFSAGIGSAVVPWLLGVFSTATTSLRTAFLIPVVLAVLIPVTLVVQKRSIDSQ